MNLTAVVDVAIGLSLMYLLLSLFATIINEKIAALFSLRARTLKSGIEAMLGNTSFVGLVGHPLIGAPRPPNPAAANPAAPSPAVPAKAGGGVAGWPSYISGQAFAMALLDSLNPDTQLTDHGTYKALIDRINQLPAADEKLKQMLRGVVNNSASSVTKVRDGIAAWFDSAMLRLEGEYKRLMQVISLLVGLAIAVAFNADTLHVAAVLWREPAIRAAVAERSVEVMSTLRQQDGQAAAPVPAPQQAQASVPSPAQAAPPPPALRLTQQQIDQSLMVLPIGWQHGDWNRIMKPWRPGGSAKETFLAAVGWLATAMAIALGAPFWFDLLVRFTNIRSAGGRPVRTPVPDGTQGRA